MEWRDGWIPGSLQFSDENLDSLISTIDQTEVILYCSCPREAQSARAALRLKRRGVGHVRPLEGGFVRWRELGFPVEIPAPQTIAAP
jgi:rhodanese-related sulfurtransferase